MANHTHQPFIAATTSLPEITLRVIVLSIILAILLGASNAYLALKIGILTSASIPAAVISMGVLRLFKNSNILENNLVQTAASAGEAVAGGIVYTIPALIIIRYWMHFPYLENLCIAIIGGVLGVMFSIPLRRILVTDKHLRFPEGRAIAEVLMVGARKALGLKEMLWGGLVGAAIELAQTGFKVIANSLEVWFTVHRGIFGFGAGFSATMIGAGYLIGFNLGLSLMVGAIIGWLVAVPVITEIHPLVLQNTTAAHAVMTLWSDEIRYMGIGTMMVAGVWTLFTLVKPLLANIQTSIQTMFKRREQSRIRTDFDMPMPYVVTGIVLTLIAMYFLFQHMFPISKLGLTEHWNIPFVLGALLFVLLVGFIISALTAYFSGLVGVSATPGSAIVIVAFLLIALILRGILSLQGVSQLLNSMLLDATAIVIIMGAIITGAAAISNDNMQDLKVGYIVGASPWKQQLMLLIGVLSASLIIPVIMELLFNVYGIGGVYPRPGMDPSQMLAAPPAALMAAVTQAVLMHRLPWMMILIGGGIAVFFILLNRYLKTRNKELSVLGVAMGIYLPLSASTPLFIGGLIALLTQRGLHKHRNEISDNQNEQNRQRGMLLACGLVAGAALMDVALAIPFSILHSPDALRILPTTWSVLAGVLGVISTLLLGLWFYRVVTGQRNSIS